MTTENSNATTEAEIRALIEARVKAVHNRDSKELVSRQVPDLVMFDALNPMQYVGADAARKRTEQWLSWYKGTIGYEVRDLSVTADEDLAFCHYLYHVSGTMTNETQVDMWLRSTICFRKVNGKWMIAHEHTSVPFDAESGKASLDLKP